MRNIAILYEYKATERNVARVGGKMEFPTYAIVKFGLFIRPEVYRNRVCNKCRDCRKLYAPGDTEIDRPAAVGETYDSPDSSRFRLGYSY